MRFTQRKIDNAGGMPDAWACLSSTRGRTWCRNEKSWHYAYGCGRKSEKEHLREELAPDHGETKKDGQVFQNTFTATLGDMVFRLKLVVQDARSMEKARELTGSETYCSV